MDTGASFPKSKATRVWCWLLPSSPEVKNYGAIPPIPHTPSWHVADYVSNYNFVGIQALTAVVMERTILQDITPCSPMKVSRTSPGPSSSLPFPVPFIFLLTRGIVARTILSRAATVGQIRIQSDVESTIFSLVYGDKVGWTSSVTW
jgi:hypothetical protein